jgi:hypothetical protein
MFVERNLLGTTSWKATRQKIYATVLSPWARRFCRVVCTVKLWRDDTSRRSWWCNVLALHKATWSTRKLQPAIWLVSQWKNISYNARRLSTVENYVTSPCGTRCAILAPPNNTTNANHDSVSPISQMSAPYLGTISQHLAHVYTREDMSIGIVPRWAVLKTLQLFYECWLEVTKHKRYHDKWLTDETYFWAIKAQFPTVELLGFDRGKLNHKKLLYLSRDIVKST